MAGLINLDRLPMDVKNKITNYLEDILKMHQDRISSIFIYGSATGRNYIKGISDINMAFIFKELDFQDLKKSLKMISRGIPKKITAPLFLTKRHIETSLDVFPMEFLEMKENHVVVYGEDLLSDLDIRAQNIRLFCEEQIKGKLIRIRQAYLEVGLAKKGVEALLKESLASFITVFRNLVRLKGKEPEKEKDRMLVQLCDEFGLDREVFLPIYRDKSNDERIGSKDVEVYLEKYIDELQKLAISVDKL